MSSPMCTRRHHKVLAGVLKSATVEPLNDAPTVVRVCSALADWLAEDNPRFDRQKFLNACGIEDVEL